MDTSLLLLCFLASTLAMPTTQDSDIATEKIDDPQECLGRCNALDNACELRCFFDGEKFNDDLVNMTTAARKAEGVEGLQMCLNSCPIAEETQRHTCIADNECRAQILEPIAYAAEDDDFNNRRNATLVASTTPVPFYQFMLQMLRSGAADD